MNKKEIFQTEVQIKQIEAETKKKLLSHPNYPRILILGLTGSGKSSLLCALAKENLIIEKSSHSDFVILSGKGILEGSRSCTKKPEIFVDEENKLLICDCPGFEDTEGPSQEIVNTFSDDILFINEDNDVQIKILLVISAPEFDTGRGEILKNTISRLKKMLPNVGKSKDFIGFVITKGEENRDARSYFKSFMVRADIKMKKWCDSFANRESQLFQFPRALRENIGKQYQFRDYDRLINFIKSDYIVNPEHYIALNNNCINEIKLIRLKHLDEINQIVAELFLRINEEYRKTNNSETTNFWLNIMHQLLDQNINKIKDFRAIFEQHIPNCEQYDDLFSKLDEYQVIDNFIDKIYDVDTITSCLQDIFRNLTHSALRELEKATLLLETSEKQGKEIEEKKEQIKQIQDEITEQNSKISDLISDNQNLQKMNSESQQEILNQTKQFQEEFLKQQNDYENKLSQMKEEFFNAKNIESSFAEENRAMMNRILELMERQENMIHNLANRPPVIVESGGCLLI